MKQTAAERGIARGHWDAAQAAILDGYEILVEDQPDGNIKLEAVVDGVAAAILVTPTGYRGYDQRQLIAGRRAVERGILDRLAGK